MKERDLNTTFEVGNNTLKNRYVKINWNNKNFMLHVNVVFYK